jgi:hypothetical protein
MLWRAIVCLHDAIFVAGDGNTAKSVVRLLLELPPSGYCFHALKASAKARSPGEPFSIAKMARRLSL